jgi:hypothetical protein
MSSQPDPLPSGNTLTDQERAMLAEAAAYLEDPSFLIRVANLVGKPAEALLNSVPERGRQLVADSTHRALRRGLDWAVHSLPAPANETAPRGRLSRFVENNVHTAATALTGAGGGLLGLPGLVVELPATTALMLRSIAVIAAEHGADLNDPATRLECLAVFSFGSEPLEEMESSYFTSRVSVALAVRQAGHFVAAHSAREISDALARGTAPLLIRLVNTIAARFQVVVSQKLAAQAVPLIGAGLGALVNAAFTDHFNRVARYHFSIVALERRYGREVVQAAYAEACRTQRARRHGRSIVRLQSLSA